MKVRKVFKRRVKYKKISKYYLPIILILSLIAGYYISNILIEKPNIAIIEIKESLSSDNVKEIVKHLRAAKENKSIKGVVLEIASPGGEASTTEELYMTVLDLRRNKPVVASVNELAVSGAYYISLGANLIYAKPSSDIGNIGAILVLPRAKKIKENVLISGPLKKAGKAKKDYVKDLQLTVESFLNAVVFQRGDRLKLNKEELAKAKIYSGIEGMRNGLIDFIGSRSDAIEKTAELAGIRNYGLVYFNDEESNKLSTSLSVNESILQATNTVPIHYYLYIQIEKWNKTKKSLY